MCHGYHWHENDEDLVIRIKMKEKSPYGQMPTRRIVVVQDSSIRLDRLAQEWCPHYSKSIVLHTMKQVAVQSVTIKSVDTLANLSPPELSSPVIRSAFTWLMEHNQKGKRFHFLHTVLWNACMNERMRTTIWPVTSMLYTLFTKWCCLRESNSLWYLGERDQWDQRAVNSSSYVGQIYEKECIMWTRHCPTCVFQYTWICVLDTIFQRYCPNANRCFPTQLLLV